MNNWFSISGQTIAVVPITLIELYLENKNKKTLVNCDRILPSKRVAQNVSGYASRYSTI